MGKDTSKSQGDAGGDKSRNQPEKGNKVGANDKGRRHDGSKDNRKNV